MGGIWGETNAKDGLVSCSSTIERFQIDISSGDSLYRMSVRFL